jgi:hypothetical protein
MNATARKVVYWATLVVVVLASVGGAFGIIPVEAVERGGVVAAVVLAAASPILALLNIKPDPPQE